MRGGLDQMQADLDRYRRDGLPSLRAAFADGHVDAARRRVRLAVERMEAEERRLLVLRTARSHQSARATSSVVVAVTLVQTALLVAVYRLVARELGRRRRAEGELRGSQELLAGVMDSSLTGVVALAAVRDDAGAVVDFTFRLVNPAAEQMLGRRSADLLGRQLLSVHPGNRDTGLFDKYARVASTGMPYDGEQYYAHDGLDFWLHIIAVRVGDGVAITFADISARRADADAWTSARDATARLAAELRDNAVKLEVARRAAEQAAVAKGNFLANMSHEIRTPIAAIIGYADLLLDPTRRESARLNDLQSIRRNGRHLLGVVNDVLDASKIDAGGMTVERIEADLPRLAADAASMTRPSAIEHGLALSVRYDTPVPRTGLTDPLRLRQALINLIGNAVKFTPAGGSVTLRVSCAGPSDTDTVVRFDVTDTGVGMTEAELGRLFQPFVQADVSTTRQFGGTGLGLTISRCFARLLGGDITVTSAPGRGSTFTLTVGVGPVPADGFVSGTTEATAEAAPPVPTAPSPSAESLAGVRVLLAEDGIDNREILTAYLRGAGADVDTVEDGRRAVDAASTAAEAGQPFDVVLMDMQMPVLDGYAATSELRRRKYAGPVVALTAHAMADDRSKCLAAGCTDYLTKPVDRQTLVAAVARHAGRAPATPTAMPSPTPAADVLRSPLSDDPKLAPVVAGFVARLTAAAAEVRQLADAGQSADLCRAAHRLRGAGGVVRLPPDQRRGQGRRGPAHRRPAHHGRRRRGRRPAGRHPPRRRLRRRGVRGAGRSDRQAGVLIDLDQGQVRAVQVIEVAVRRHQRGGGYPCRGGDPQIILAHLAALRLAPDIDVGVGLEDRRIVDVDDYQLADDCRQRGCPARPQFRLAANAWISPLVTTLISGMSGVVSSR